MNIYFYISERIRRGNKGSFSAIVSVIATTTIALGICVLMLSFSVLEGFKREIRKKIFSLASHIQVRLSDNNESYEENPVPLNTEFYKNWRNDRGIEHVQIFCHKAGLLHTKKEVQGVVMKGVGDDYDVEKVKYAIVEGNFLNIRSNQVLRDIVVSKQIARKMMIKTGDSVIMFFVQDPPKFRKLNVIGIYDTGLEEFDNHIIFGDIKLIRQINNWPDTLAGGYEIFLKDYKKMDDYYDIINGAINFDMVAELVVDRYPQIFEWLSLLDRNVLVFWVLILAVCCFNMVSSIFIMIMERTPMIGSLKAFGATNLQVQSIFLFNGLTIILRGLLLGNLIGLLLCYVQYQFKIIPLNPENYYMNHVPIHWDVYAILALNLLIFFVTLLILCIPVMFISYIKPVKSIKFC
ncbi:MAG: ABC transporter permease [Cytophagaceae bacterium]|nr:ABC transporter permease [Cytophagaceae bacterium]MDW8456477.1 FtsX-like permease family protein [Cytophagaceae bacterium]